MNPEELQILKNILIWGGIMTLLYESKREDLIQVENELKTSLFDAFNAVLTYDGNNPYIISGIKGMVDSLDRLHAFYPNLKHILGKQLTGLTLVPA